MPSSNLPSPSTCPSLPGISTSYFTPDFSLCAPLRSVSMPAVYSALCPRAHRKRCCSSCCFQSIEEVRNAAFPMSVPAYPVHQLILSTSLSCPPEPRPPQASQGGQFITDHGAAVTIDLPSVLGLTPRVFLQLYPVLWLWHLPSTSASP